MKTTYILLLVAALLVVAVIALFQFRNLNPKAIEGSFSDCDIDVASEVRAERGEDYEYINPHRGFTDDCAEIRVFNPDILTEEALSRESGI